MSHKSCVASQIENRPLVSIVIPVYGVERFLRSCINNVCKQTYSNLEIIIIDDGSPDNCGKICDEYAQKDKRVIVRHTSNRGLSAARNLGLDISSGEYIIFIDSDDVPGTTYVETAIDAMEKYDCDIVTSHFRWIDENDDPYQYDSPHNRYDSVMILNREEALSQVFHNQLESFAWIYVTKRELWNNPPVRFPEGRVLEDIATTYKVIGRSNKVVKLTDITYSYRYRRSSIMNSSGKRLTLDAAENSVEHISFIKSAGLSKEVTDSIIIRSFAMLIACYYNLLRHSEATDEEIEKVRKYLYSCASVIQSAALPFGTKLRWLMVRLHMAKILVLIDVLWRR